ncbi:hypothetical protein GCM10007067_06280 [Lysobacter bugurensis]|uniref:Uncharacterized protein n=1 Tax=Cognatilysobacter bugurensis TaxID=543356 RepID=A0A918SWK0_9GAMM|nr:hypothetical protein GCM10007067_06280 [Lysobacter bugurensis]
MRMQFREALADARHRALLDLKRGPAFVDEVDRDYRAAVYEQEAQQLERGVPSAGPEEVRRADVMRVHVRRFGWLMDNT